MNGVIAYSTIAEYFEEELALDSFAAFMIAIVIHAIVVVHVFAFAPLVFIWLERKVAGRIQDRVGPTRVGGGPGWLQSLADGIKLIQKEDLIPSDADSVLFRMAPYIACIASFGAFLVLPFSDGWVAVTSDIGLFILFAILSLEVVGIVLAGYSSGSKWSLYGGMREAAQMVSYEIPLAICGLVPVVAVGSLNLVEVGQFQAGGIQEWLLFHNPFIFIAFFVYFVVATAGCKRAPFDLAEAESELVGGFHTEYSGMRWSFFFMAEYASMFLVCIVAAILFLGAWHTGIPPVDLALQNMRAAGIGATSFTPQTYLANLLGAGVIITKGSILVFVQMWLRWTLPRLRIDQVMMTCLKYLLPISCVLFLGAVLWPLVLASTTGRTQLIPNVAPTATRLPQSLMTKQSAQATDAGMKLSKRDNDPATGEQQ